MIVEAVDTEFNTNHHYRRSRSDVSSFSFQISSEKWGEGVWSRWYRDV